MRFRDMRTLLRFANACFPGVTLSALTLKLRMLREGWSYDTALQPFLSPAVDSALAKVIAQRPQILGALVWPYQCAAWDARERLERIRVHYAEIDRIGAKLKFDLDEKLVIAKFYDVHKGLHVIIDQPRWFMREGGLVLNLFIDKFRAFSLAFSFYRDPQGDVVAVLGGLQGRNQDGALDLYRALTKDMHGLRPRDFLIEVLRVFCRHFEINVIHAVTQAHRHHVHPFFNNKNLTPNYDEIWEDRRGSRIDEFFYALPVCPEMRDLSTVKPNKRSLYRKRFALLDEVESRVVEGLSTVVPTKFLDS